MKMFFARLLLIPTFLNHLPLIIGNDKSEFINATSVEESE